MVDMQARVQAGRPLSDGMIAAILKCKRHDEGRVHAEAAAIEPGMYRKGSAIFKVQRARESGNLYAKSLVRLGGRRLAEDGDVVRWEFQYSPGAIRGLSAEDRMTLTEAKHFGIEFGVCCVCGATLKDAASVQAGIGPVCAGRV